MIYSVLFRILSIILLGIATFDLPYEYYTFLRFYMCICCALWSFSSLKFENKFFFFTFGFVAILFNPIFKFSFVKDTWIIIDLIVASLLFISLFFKKTHFDNT